MSVDPNLPGQHGELVTPELRPTRWWMDWFRRVDARLVATEATATAASDAVAAIPAANPTTINPSGTIEVYGNAETGYTLEVSEEVLALGRVPGPPGRDGEDGADSYVPGPKGDRGDPGPAGSGGGGTTIIVQEEHYEESWPIVPQSSAVAGASAASAVSITDAGAYFTGTDVEAALQELGAAGSGSTFPRTTEPFPFRGVWGRWQYVPNATTTTTIGANTSLMTVQGTAGAVNRANTNSYTRQPRAVFTSAAGAGSASGIYNNTTVFSDTGGFHFSTRFGFADAATVANARALIGVRNATAAPANADPSSYINFVGIGYDSGDANLQLMHNDGAGTATKTDLGANFPANSLSTDFYEVQFESQPASGTVQWHIRNVRTGNTDTGTVTTDLPATGTDLGPIMWRNNGATALAVKLELSGVVLAYTLEG